MELQRYTYIQNDTVNIEKKNQRQRSIYFNSMPQAFYAYIAVVHSVAICFFAYGYTLVRARNQCYFYQGYAKKCPRLMLLCSNALK